MSVVDIKTGQPAGKPPANQNGGTSGGNYGERLAAIEAHLHHMATKEDIQRVKVWFLGGVVGGMVSACIIALTFIKVFGS